MGGSLLRWPKGLTTLSIFVTFKSALQSGQLPGAASFGGTDFGMATLLLLFDVCQ
jgi:hypothetical protein